MSTHPLAPKRVLMLGFDAAAPDLVEEGIAEGWLPHLRRLRERGIYGRLQSTSEWLVSSHWASFAMGVPPQEHGTYHFMQWRADEMALRRLDPSWILREPFWRELGRDGVRIVAMDVPYTTRPKTDETVELSGWATSEVIFRPYAQPGRLKDLIRGAYGRLPRRVGEGLTFEKFAPQPLHDLLLLRDQLVEITNRSSSLAVTIMEREPWELCLTVFGGAHRAGHLFWSSSSVEGEVGPVADPLLRDALRDVYTACDRAIGRVVGRAGEDTTVLVFSLIGMARNTSRTDLLPSMLARVLSNDPTATAAHERLGFARRLRKAIPPHWRHRVKAGLPLALQDRLSTFWRAGRSNWARTRAFSLTADVHGYIRINLRGREKLGTVEPGPEYDRLCSEIRDGLMDFVDGDTREPIVAAVERTDQLFPPAHRNDALPDLIVRWAPTACADCREIASPRFGQIPWPTPGKNPNARSGNHTGEGFLIAAGTGIPRGATLTPAAHILDLPPTVYALLGKRPPSYMRGSILSELSPLVTTRHGETSR